MNPLKSNAPITPDRIDSVLQFLEKGPNAQQMIQQSLQNNPQAKQTIEQLKTFLMVCTLVIFYFN